MFVCVCVLNSERVEITKTRCPLKDTRLLGVGYRSSAASCHVAVEGHLQRVTVGCVIEEAAKEPSASTGLHHIPVEGRVGLEGCTETATSETVGQSVQRYDTQ